jgi:hypothetical protein
LWCQRRAVRIACVRVKDRVLSFNVVLVACGDGRTLIHTILAHAVAVDRVAELVRDKRLVAAVGRGHAKRG